MINNPLKWLIKGPIYLLMSPLWIVGNLCLVIEVTFYWAFSSVSWKKAYKRTRQYQTDHLSY